MGEIANGKLHAANLHSDIAKLRVRKFQKFIEKAEFVHNFERGRMNGVAAEIAQEISVLLEDENFHASARQQICQHHARGPSAHDATTDVECLNSTLLHHGR